MNALSISKLESGIVNEDAVICTDSLIAVSDGAGGGGVFADLWSKYLINHLPNSAITEYSTFDNWLDSIWEPFYNNCEQVAKEQGGMLLNKFYDEGSFATIVTVWEDGSWISYGDSVGFCYNIKTGEFQHTFGNLSEFNEAPFLINCKEPTEGKGFKSGKFNITEDTIVFAASDTLAHYILMMYKVSKKQEFAGEIEEAIKVKSKNSNYISCANNLKRINFEKDVIIKLQNCKNKTNFKRHIQKLLHLGLIGHDDYSLVFM